MVVLACLAGSAGADPFEPPSSVAAAQEHYLRGKSLYASKHYPEAAGEFAAAIALDPDAKFLLFDLGLAQRMAGDCSDAIAAYQSFLDAGPPAAYADSARIGIERCQRALTAPPVTPPPAVVPTRAATALTTERIVAVHDPWYRDRLGDVLAGGGVACGLAAGVLYVIARSAGHQTFTASTLGEFQSGRDRASTDQTASWIVGVAGAAFITGAVIRYATRTPSLIAVSPTRGGAAVAVETSF